MFKYNHFNAHPISLINQDTSSKKTIERPKKVSKLLPKALSIITESDKEIDEAPIPEKNPGTNAVENYSPNVPKRYRLPFCIRPSFKYPLQFRRLCHVKNENIRRQMALK
ncbi:hypothetical protein EMCRGX_G021927 [Ephydatia muelleri]